MSAGKSGNGKAGRKHELALARMELKQELSVARTARKRVDLLISHPKCEALVPTLPAEDLYFTMKEVGLSDCVELVRLASAEQFRAFVDLDAWKRDQLDPAAALTWLRAAGTDDSEERFRKKLHALDVEVLELVLRQTTRVHDLEEDPDPEFEGVTFRSPEGKYLVEYLVEGAEQAGVKRVLDELYAEDPFRTARLLEAVRWEMPSELEETAFRWRNGRLQDLGFPDLGEAMSYFAWLDPDADLPAMDVAPAVPDSFFLARLAPQGRFLDAALAQVSEVHRDVLERQLVTLLNAVMVVDAVDPGDLDQVQRALGAARDTLSLGLEHAAKGDAVAAGLLLVSAPVKRLFQVGVGCALRLKFRADRLAKSGKVQLAGVPGETLLDEPWASAFAGVRRKRPLLAESPEVQRSFRDRADVARVGELLADAERVADVFAALGFEPARAAEAAQQAVPVDQLGALRFSDLLLTALAREAAGEAFAFEPLSSGKLRAFADQAFRREEGGVRLTDGFRKLAVDRIRAAKGLSAEHVGAAERYLEKALERLLDEAGEPWSLGTLRAGEPLPLLLTRA